MQIKKLELLLKLYKEELEQILIELKIQQDLFDKYKIELNHLTEDKYNESQNLNNNYLLNKAYSHYLIKINKDIENKQHAMNACQNRIEKVQNTIQEKFASIKQIELLIAKHKQKLLEKLNKNEQATLDEIASNNY
ncbi:flagellar FliJ family protein [Rickettsiales endosymbiont of Stachyamoeba lipophora]|uniref:flagellar FliJ family protein n=1 Tax=Rickettsiales endosymbiont of Stachyamoeba lipophora TaxID=2486578 RepID=UPI000F6488C8|nr:flagellar FliJ family protein [Rickettsiales endosymbiont of Stachyamoeba lipophora]AZL16170.1 hypothetical protein EF513_06465 [Rickettsiales endosymbiont of Stachyamoeba lipophora]